jgi:phosphoribosyl-ATP pyrophosphohydrolase
MALTISEVRALSDHELLGKVAEESSEVIKAAMKHQGKGARPHVGGVQYNNVRDVNEEFFQLHMLIDDYRRRFGWL